MKHFLKRILLGTLPLGLLLVGCLYYEWEIRPDLTGDLGQLGKIRFGEPYQERIVQPKLDTMRVVDFRPGVTQPLDWGILSIGDSFSVRGIQGYQNFLAHRLERTLVNWPEYGVSPEQTAVELLNSGFFDTLPTRWVVVESVQRSSVERILTMDLEAHYTPRATAETSIAYPEGLSERLRRIRKQGFDWMLLQAHLAKNPVKRASLNRPLFTAEGRECELWFYRDDLDLLACDEATLARYVAGIEQLQERFAERGINLIYLVAPDKYDLYQPYAEARYPERQLGAQMQEAFCGMERVLFPLAEFRRMLEQGHPDLYAANDTHWGQEGAAHVADLLFDTISEFSTSDNISETER